MAIEASHYGETRQRLIADPVVLRMATDIQEGLREGYVSIEDLVHLETMTPRFGFMQASNEQYRHLGGTDGGHIGAVAEAIIMILEARS